MFGKNQTNNFSVKSKNLLLSRFIKKMVYNKMEIRENNLAIGMISLAIGIIIGRFTDFNYLYFSISHFLEGLFIGLSIVMNLYYLATKSKK